LFYFPQTARAITKPPLKNRPASQPRRGFSWGWETFKLKVPSKSIDWEISPAVAAQISQRRAESAQRVVDAREAIEDFRTAPVDIQHDRLSTAFEAIVVCSSRVNSHKRLSTVLDLIASAPSEIFWPAFISEWDCCDNTWPDRTKLLKCLRRHSRKTDPASRYPSVRRREREFYDALPSRLRVFRGCSQPRVYGVSWTTDRSVAVGFAKGHRGIRVSDAVIASAEVSREAIFFASLARNESELVVDPCCLHRLIVEPYNAKSGSGSRQPVLTQPAASVR
jgi:hypothetical protein